MKDQKPKLLNYQSTQSQEFTSSFYNEEERPISKKFGEIMDSNPSSRINEKLDKEPPLNFEMETDETARSKNLLP